MKRLPSREEVRRAIEYTGWAYQSCYQTATDIYREKYGNEPNFAVDAPDSGLLYALDYLDLAMAALEASIHTGLHPESLCGRDCSGCVGLGEGGY